MLQGRVLLGEAGKVPRSRREFDVVGSRRAAVCPDVGEQGPDDVGDTVLKGTGSRIERVAAELPVVLLVKAVMQNRDELRNGCISACPSIRRTSRIDPPEDRSEECSTCVDARHRGKRRVRIAVHGGGNGLLLLGSRESHRVTALALAPTCESDGSPPHPRP